MIKIMLNLFLIFSLFFFNIYQESNEYGQLTMGLSYFDEPIIDIKECLFETQSIHILKTSQGDIFTSQNFGFDWTKIELQKNIQFTKLLQNEHYQNFIALIGSRNQIVISRNCLLDFSIIELQSVDKINSLYFNSQQQNLILIEAEKITFDKQQDEIIKKKNKLLYYSKNFCQDILLIQENIQEAFWFENEQNTQRIVAIVKNPLKKFNNNIWDINTKLVVTNDFFKTVQILGQSVNKLIRTKKYFYVSKILNSETQEIKLNLLKDDNQLTLQQIQLPQMLKDYYYTLQNENSKEVFLHITHEKNQQFGDLYLSENGIDFFLIIKNVIKDSFGFIDLIRLNWSNGTFVINQKNSNKTQTMITHNYGVDWKLINEQNPLHFHQQSSDYFTTLFSDQNLPGLIIANGNQGQNLKDKIVDIHTYISIDYGQSFNKIFDFPCVFQSSNDGNFIILIQENEPTSKMSFSVDQGHSFKTIQILEDDFQVLDIQRSQYDQFKFMINGIQVVRKQKYGITIPIDFRQLIEKECQEEQLHAISSPCLLGQIQKISRKKKTSTCLYNNQKIEIAQQCECTQKDYLNGFFFGINKCKMKEVEKEIEEKLPLGIFDLSMITMFTFVIFVYKKKIRDLWRQRNQRYLEINDKIKINQYFYINSIIDELIINLTKALRITITLLIQMHSFQLFFISKKQSLRCYKIFRNGIQYQIYEEQISRGNNGRNQSVQKVFQ